MKKQPRPLKRTLFLLSLALVPQTMASLEAAPLSSTAAQQSAQAAFVPQNKSEVERLHRAKIGWSALQASMIQSGASATEAGSVLKRSRWAVRHILFLTWKPSMWPIFARRAAIGGQHVWVVEAAAPDTHFGYCPTGMSSEQIAQIEARNPQRCVQSVLVVQAHAPFKILARYDTSD